MVPSIWQTSDHRPVSAAEAQLEWTLRATEILVEVAGRHGRSIEYADLGPEIQRRTGIMTDLPTPDWLDDVLAEVAQRCAEAGKPVLTMVVDDPDTPVSAAARASVYEAYGAKPLRSRATSRIKSPTRRPTTGATRSKRTITATQRRRPVCPTCFVELPVTGVCDDCDA